MEPRAAQFRLELRLLAEALSYVSRLKQRWLLWAISAALRVWFFVYDMVAVSAVMQVGLALPMAIYFHRVSFSGLSANVLIVPLLSVIVPVGFFAVLTGWMAAAQLAAWLLTVSENIARWHVRWEPDWRIPDPPTWIAIAFAAALIGFAFALQRSRVWRVVALATVTALFVFILWHPFPPKIAARALELTAVDVGQGDSLLVSFPRGKLMLVDGGGILSFGRKVKPKMDIGEDVVSPYLWSRSIRRLDVVVATHAHEDHTGGLAAIIDNFHPKEIWTGAHGDEPVWRELSRHARERGVTIVAMCEGKRMEFGGTRVEVLAPPEDYVANGAPKNNDSLALRITYGSRSFLLTGDMEKQIEGRLLADGRELKADVLKVGHHGSKTSTTEPFLDAVHPAFAIISDGYDNSFGHPNREVLERLHARRVEVLRTDLQGLITVRTDGQRISVGYNGAQPE
jgi:competence protein ComEC